jgi:hypothetical protein
MINIFVTYRCNLSCAYCFATELSARYPGDMRADTFDRLLVWMKKAAVPAAAFIGGEPTRHPGLVDMIERTSDAGIAVVLFTNGIFPAALADRLTASVSNFVVNYNDPALYPPAWRAWLEATLSMLVRRGARITFSKNFSPDALSFDYLLEGARRYRVRFIRYDLSRPSQSAVNDHFPKDRTREIMSHIVSFVGRCETDGIRTGMDCCLKWCDLSAADRRYLKRVSMKLTGICHPSVDVHPDLSASYCLPLHDVRVPDVTAFADRFSLMGHFSQMVRGRRFEPAGAACTGCSDFKRTCQGGCLASKRVSVEDRLVSAA